MNIDSMGVYGNYYPMVTRFAVESVRGGIESGNSG
jgi:hypothetical protein